MPSPHSPLSPFQRRLIFIGGKGGVGKSMISAALAAEFARRELKTLWVTIEDHDFPMGESRTGFPGAPPLLTHLNIEANRAFEEYIGLKLGVAGLARIFVGNKLVRYMAEAAPGLHDLVIMGKIWYEREHFDRIVVDLPSTGYGLSMFQSPANFARLFQGGPIQRDAHAMLATLGDASQSGHLLIALPEEMPLQESLELKATLASLFPANPASLLVNRVLPGQPPALNSTDQGALFVSTVDQYLAHRMRAEAEHLAHLRALEPDFATLPYFDPPVDTSASERQRLQDAVSVALGELL